MIDLYLAISITTPNVNSQTLQLKGKDCQIEYQNKVPLRCVQDIYYKYDTNRLKVKGLKNIY